MNDMNDTNDCFWVTNSMHFLSSCKQTINYILYSCIYLFDLSGSGSSVSSSSVPSSVRPLIRQQQESTSTSTDKRLRQSNRKAVFATQIKTTDVSKQLKGLLVYFIVTGLLTMIIILQDLLCHLSWLVNPLLSLLRLSIVIPAQLASQF